VVTGGCTDNSDYPERREFIEVPFRLSRKAGIYRSALYWDGQGFRGVFYGVNVQTHSSLEIHPCLQTQTILEKTTYGLAKPKKLN